MARQLKKEGLNDSKETLPEKKKVYFNVHFLFFFYE